MYFCLAILCISASCALSQCALCSGKDGRGVCQAEAEAEAQMATLCFTPFPRCRICLLCILYLSVDIFVFVNCRGTDGHSLFYSFAKVYVQMRSVVCRFPRNSGSAYCAKYRPVQDSSAQCSAVQSNTKREQRTEKEGEVLGQITK